VGMYWAILVDCQTPSLNETKSLRLPLAPSPTHSRACGQSIPIPKRIGTHWRKSKLSRTLPEGTKVSRLPMMVYSSE
jgi:hypothetical protein